MSALVSCGARQAIWAKGYTELLALMDADHAAAGRADPVHVDCYGSGEDLDEVRGPRRAAEVALSPPATKQHAHALRSDALALQPARRMRPATLPADESITDEQRLLRAALQGCGTGRKFSGLRSPQCAVRAGPAGARRRGARAPPASTGRAPRSEPARRPGARVRRRPRAQMRALAEKKDLHLHFHGPRDHLDSSIHEYQVRAARACRQALPHSLRGPLPPGAAARASERRARRLPEGLCARHVWGACAGCLALVRA